MNGLGVLAFARRAAAAFGAAAALLHAAPLLAHDLWIEPTAWSASPGQVVGARVRVGQHLQGDLLPLAALQMNRYFIDDGDARRPLRALRGDTAAVRVAREGLHVVAYASDPIPIEIVPETFNAYLGEEGLDAVIAERSRLGQTASAGKEQYRRCAKSLLAVGAAASAQQDRALGLALELVAERNPYAVGPGGELPLRLIFEGRPLAGALVVALDAGGAEQRARSDAEGRVRLRVGSGLSLVKAVHMVRADPATGADWSSYWASLTYGLPAAP